MPKVIIPFVGCYPSGWKGCPGTASFIPMSAGDITIDVPITVETWTYPALGEVVAVGTVAGSNPVIHRRDAE